MKIGLFLFLACWCLPPSIGMAADLEQDSFAVNIQVPSVFNIGASRVMPVKLSVLGEGANSFNGQVDIWTTEGRFIDANGVSSNSVKVQFEKGLAEVSLNLDWRPSSDVAKLTAATGPYNDPEELGNASVALLYPNAFAVLPYECVLGVLANGLEHPIIAVEVKDQFGKPLPDCESNISDGITENGKVHAPIVERTGADGIVRFWLPGSESAQPFQGWQVLVAGWCSDSLFVYHIGKSMRMANLRGAVDQINAELSWDASNREATVRFRGFKVNGHELKVKDGDSFARLNGAIAAMGGKATIKNGQLQLPTGFLNQCLLSSSYL